MANTPRLVLPFIAFVVSVPAVAEVDVDRYLNEAKEEQKKELKGHSELCQYLTSDACSMMEYVLSPEVGDTALDGSDRLILSQVMQIGRDDVQAAEGAVEDQLRRKTLRNAAMTFGHSIGVAHESSRYNRLWEESKDLFDRVVRFDVLMLDSEYGTNILPAVVSQTSGYSATIEEGRTFRAAGKIYRIDEQPRFVRSAPTWRDFLTLTYKRPVLPPQALLPTTAAEADLFRVALIRGYVGGIETAKQRAVAAYSSLEHQFDGMVLYHLLLAYEMITPPIVSTDFNAVAVNAVGNEMSIDDIIMRIKVLPRLDGNANNWKALPILNEFEQSMKRRHIRNKLADWGGDE